MNKKTVKCIILDFDNTLYSFGDWGHEAECFGRYFVEKGLLEEYGSAQDRLVHLLDIYPNFHIIQATFAYLHDNNIDDSEYRIFCDENICEIIGEDTVFVDPKVISELSKFYDLYIISDSSVPYIEHYLDYAKINKDNFKGIYSNEYKDAGYSKLSMMKKVLNETKLEPKEILMIGDSLKSDITPAKLMGFQTCHVENGLETEKILQSFNNLKNSKKI